jgi:hypothetical protein
MQNQFCRLPNRSIKRLKNKALSLQVEFFSIGEKFNFRWLTIERLWELELLTKWSIIQHGDMSLN